MWTKVSHNWWIWIENSPDALVFMPIRGLCVQYRRYWEECVVDRFHRHGSAHPADALLLRATDPLEANVAAEFLQGQGAARCGSPARRCDMGDGEGVAAAAEFIVGPEWSGMCPSRINSRPTC